MAPQASNTTSSQDPLKAWLEWGNPAPQGVLFAWKMPLADIFQVAELELSAPRAKL